MVDGLITLAAWLTVLAPFIIFGAVLIWLFKKIPKNTPYEHNPLWNRPMWQSTETKTYKTPEAKTEEPVCPEVTSIDKESFEEEIVDCRKLVDPGKRVYRTYRSDDHVQWSECEPALTERAACNYAQYMKIANPNQFVIAKDPEGLILFYE